MPFATPKIEKTPWHLWLIGFLGLIWSAMGAMDYVLTQMRQEDYMSAFNAEQIAFFYGFPKWVVASWAVAVWGGVIGSILLLLRKPLAVGFYLVSLLAILVTTYHNYFLDKGMEIMGDPMIMSFNALIVLVAFTLFAYARNMQKRGYLY